MKYKFILLLVFKLFTFPSLCKDFFISNQGNDKNAGSKEKPWKSINMVNSKIYKPGDKIFFKGGESFSGNLIVNEKSTSNPTNPITISSYGEGKATILAGDLGILVKNRSGIVVQDIIVAGANRTTNQVTDTVL
ncbi:MAG: hypothetical protein M3512_07545 [Bacteroidota bacterium]|nr:hypothetical protein [Bacteroidota bacterium]